MSDTISEDIKNRTFKPVYLIFGDEGYLRENYRRRLTEALVTPGDTLNWASYSGAGVSAKEVVSLASTMPFMAEKRVILVRDSGWFKTSCE